MKKKSDGAEVLLSSIAKGIFEKKGLNVLKIDLRKLENRITDYFVICHASSTTQVSAICDSVEDLSEPRLARNRCILRDLIIVSGYFWITAP